MADALDYVMQLRREKLAREQQASDTLMSGVQTGIDAFLKAKQLGVSNQLDQLKLQNQLVQNKLLSDALGGTSGGGNMVMSGLGPSGPTFTNIQASQQEEAAKVKARKTAEANFAKGELKKTLSGILAMESTIPRSEEGGLDRFYQGAQNSLSGFLQNSAIGENVNSYQKAVDLVTPKIARAAGDVANIAVAERQFSKGAFPTLSDSKGTATKKRKFLQDFTRAVDSDDNTEIKKLLDSQGIPYFDMIENKWVNMNEEEMPTSNVSDDVWKKALNTVKK